LLASRTDWNGKEGQAFLSHLSQALARLDNVAEVRSLTQPLGVPTGPGPAAGHPPAGRPRCGPEDPRKGLLAGFVKTMKRNFVETVEDHTRRAVGQFYLARLPPSAGEPDWLVAPGERGPSGGPAPVHVTRLDVVLHSDPFDPGSIPTHEVIRAWLQL